MHHLRTECSFIFSAYNAEIKSKITKLYEKQKNQHEPPHPRSSREIKNPSTHSPESRVFSSLLATLEFMICEVDVEMIGVILAPAETMLGVVSAMAETSPRLPMETFFNLSKLSWYDAFVSEGRAFTGAWAVVTPYVMVGVSGSTISTSTKGISFDIFEITLRLGGRSPFFFVVIVSSPQLNFWGSNKGANINRRYTGRENGAYFIPIVDEDGCACRTSQVVNDATPCFQEFLFYISDDNA